MSSIEQFLSSIVIRLRSITLILLNLFMNNLVRRLTILDRLTKFIDRHVQSFVSQFHRNEYVDFNIGTTANQLFEKENNDNNPDIHDVFHIYVSKLLYETPERITEECLKWGFNKGSIKPFHYSQIKDLKKYTYDTQAAVINHDESNTIIVAFRGTQSRDLLQWMTDASTDFIPIDNVFNDDVNDKILVHGGFYSALGLSAFNPSQPIDFSKVTKDSPIFIQILDSIQKIHRNDNKYNISVTGHSLGAALASLFSFVLLAYGYESSISGVYTYGQPLVGNRRYAEILNNKLGKRIHRWVNHSDIVPRIPVIEFPSIAWYYARTPYSDALEVAANDKQTKSDAFHKHYYHSGLRFKINNKGNLVKQDLIDQGPILAYQDRLDLFHFIYAFRNAIYSLFNISPLRSILWLITPTEINDHHVDDYVRNIKNIVTKNK